MRANLSGEGDRLIDWTGERCVPWADDVEVVYEHYHRYLFAATQVADRRVLDLASGEGFGAALLAMQAREVVGIDIDDMTVSHASRNYQLPNLSFRQGDMLDLSAIESRSFDVVVCFEAVEHVSDHPRLLEGVARVLKDDGIFVASTPDRDVSEVLHQSNPFHVQELSPDEFEGWLRSQFPHVRLWGQNVAVGSVIVPLEPAATRGELTTLTFEPETGRWVSGTKLVPRFVLGVAGRTELGELPAYNTLVDTGLTLVRRPTRERDAAREDLRRTAAEHEGLRSERDELRQALELALSARDAAEHEALELTTAYEQSLASLRRFRRSEQRAERHAERLRSALTEARQVVHESQQRQEQLTHELEQLTSSAWYRLRSAYSSAIELLAPQTSLRRRAYGLVVSGVAGSRSHRSTKRGAVLSPPPLISLPTVDDPEVTIVMPVHNHWSLTAECLQSIGRDVSAPPYAVVVVDDASTDETSEMLEVHVSGVEVVRLTTNVGFVRAVNAGVAAARSRYVVLLNNDTVVVEGWLDALLETAEGSDDIGVVGAKLVYPDGTLQEAGGIVFSDGTAWNYGRGDDPADPAYNFRRDVDYCSGACLLVRRDVFDAVGGLDARFAPAYYEDTDLAFAARRLGYRVVYEPGAVVVHMEGGSNGTDPTAGTKRFQLPNREVFRAKWEAELAMHVPEGPGRVRSASWRTKRGRVLVVDEHIPTPNQDSGSRRMWELLCILRDLGFGVTFLANSGHDMPAYCSILREAGIEVLGGPGCLPDFLSDVGTDLRAAFLCRPEPAWRQLPVVRRLCPQAKVIYDTVDLHYVRQRRRAEVEGSVDGLRAAEHQRQIELTLAATADATLVVSPVERELLLDELPNLAVHVVPNVHRDEPAGNPFARREGLLFVGSFPHDPNRDAAHWLVEEILPYIRSELGDVPTYIVGSRPTADIWALEGDGVRVLGWVPDLGDLYVRARVFVAPLRYGAGMKGKVGESLAHGLPVVTTRIGAEGMGLEHGDDVLVADGAEAFAAEVVRVYRDSELWTALARHGRRTISRRYSPDAVRPLLAQVLSELRIPVG